MGLSNKGNETKRELVGRLVKMAQAVKSTDYESDNVLKEDIDAAIMTLNTLKKNIK